MAAEHFWMFGGNEGTNKKIRKHQSFKEYWNEGNRYSKRVIMANTEWVTALLVCNTYIVHAGVKCIRSCVSLLSQSNSY